MAAQGAGRAARPLTVAGILLVGELISTSATAGGATTINSLQARAAAIADAVVADQSQLAQLGERYVGEEQALSAARRAEQAAAAAASKDLGRIAGDRAALRRSAIEAYVSAGTAESSLELLLTRGTTTASSGLAYLSVESGQLTGHISALDNDEHRLQVLDATARSHARDASNALAGLQRDRQGALGELAAERRSLTEAKGQLAALVAARARAAAEAAARAAAAAAAARAAAAAAATSAPGDNSGTATATAGPPSLGTVLAGPPAAIPTGSLASAFAGIRNCESSDNYRLNTGNGYYGAYQFSASTWAGLGGSGLASAAPPADQDAAAYRLYQQDGFASWPECAAILGL